MNNCSSVCSYVSNGKDDIGTNGTIHIFSVATGRLYERFLRYNYIVMNFMPHLFYLQYHQKYLDSLSFKGGSL